MLPTIGRLLDQSFSSYEQQWRTLVRLGSWIFVLVFINFLILTVYPIDIARAYRDLTGWEAGSAILYILNNIVGGIVIGVWTINMIIGAIHRFQTKQSLNVTDIARQAWKQFIPQLKTSLALFTTLVIALGVPTAIIFSFIDWVAPFLPLLLGQLIVFLLLFGYIPALAVIFLTVFASIACVVDGVSGFQALKKSALHIRTHANALLPRILLPKLLYITLFLLVQYLLIKLFSLVIDGTVLSEDLNSRLHQMGNIISYALPILFLNPLMLLTDYFLYTSAE